MVVDIERLKRDMKNECLGAFFGGGFGGALSMYSDIDRATPEQLIEMAERQDIDLDRYITED